MMTDSPAGELLRKQMSHETPAKGRRKNTNPVKRSHEEVASKTKKIKKHKSPTPSPTQSDSEGTEKSLTVEEIYLRRSEYL